MAAKGRPKGAKTKKEGAKNTSPPWARSLTEREKIKEQVARLELQGYGKTAISEKLGIAPMSVYNLQKEIQQDYQDAYVDNRKAWVMRATAAHLDVIREAQEQIERIKTKGKRKRVREEGTGEKGGWSKEGEVVEDGEIGGYLSIITENWTRIARLHGLEELPKTVFNVLVDNRQINPFDAAMEAMRAACGLAPSAPQSIEDLPAAKEIPEAK